MTTAPTGCEATGAVHHHKSDEESIVSDRKNVKFPNVIRAGGEIAYVAAEQDAITIRIGNSSDILLTNQQAMKIGRDVDLHPVTPNAVIDVLAGWAGEPVGFQFGVRGESSITWIRLTEQQVRALDLEAQGCAGEPDGEPCLRVAERSGYCEVCS